jgi:HNH endonuclease
VRAGTIAPTDYGWYRLLEARGRLDEVNFWRPSAKRRFLAPQFSPFLFKLKAPHNAICGFGFFARYSALPVWLAWETFGIANGCETRREMEERIGSLREGMRYRGDAPADHIGCILVVQPYFFPPDELVPQPSNWPARNLTPMRWDLGAGEGQRVWAACLERVRKGHAAADSSGLTADRERFGAPQLIQPRLGQGTFRIAVTEAYGRACAVTGEHSLPALEAAHIRPYSEQGPHETRNGLLLRADFHRLFDEGYVTVTPEHRLEVSGRLREEFENGKSYYPFHGASLRGTLTAEDLPDASYLRWHNEEKYRG